MRGGCSGTGVGSFRLRPYTTAEQMLVHSDCKLTAFGDVHRQWHSDTRTPIRCWGTSRGIMGPDSWIKPETIFGSLGRKKKKKKRELIIIFFFKKEKEAPILWNSVSVALNRGGEDIKRMSGKKDQCIFRSGLWMRRHGAKGGGRVAALRFVLGSNEPFDLSSLKGIFQNLIRREVNCNLAVGEGDSDAKYYSL